MRFLEYWKQLSNMLINKDNYPNILNALQTIDLDNGAVNRYEPLKEEYDIDEPFDFEQIDRALSCLSEVELEDFLCGSDEDAAAIICHRPALDVVDEFLMSFCNGELTDR